MNKVTTKKVHFYFDNSVLPSNISKHYNI